MEFNDNIVGTIEVIAQFNDEDQIDSKAATAAAE